MTRSALPIILIGSILASMLGLYIYQVMQPTKPLIGVTGDPDWNEFHNQTIDYRWSHGIG